MILLKFWAKKVGGYKAVKESTAFRFLECFTNSNWKYYNLEREGLEFLNYYTPEKIDYGKFILKTKNNGLVYEAGLIPDSAGYELVKIEETKRAKDPK